MQSVPDWPVDSPVTVPGAQVLLGGAEREVITASVTASVRDTDVSARTGSVEWAPPSDVFQRQETVLSASAPRRGDRVTVSAGEGTALARLLTGRIDTTGNAVPGGLVSELVDDYWQLDTEVDVPSLIARMTPYQDGGPLRQIGLTATWPTQRVLSQCGFYATPPSRVGAVMSASLNGSLWPEFGALTTSATMPAFSPSPWGEAPHGFTAYYSGGSRSMSDDPLEVSFLVDPTVEAGNTFVTVNFDGGLIRVSADGNGAVRVQMSTGTLSTVLSLAPAEMAGQELVRLRVTAAGEWVLTNGAVTKTATATVPAALRAVPVNVIVSVPAGGRRIGGVNVGYYTTTPPAWSRTAVIDAPDGTLAASRAIVSTPAKTVLHARAAAEHARMWIDAHGVFQWRSRGRWGAGAPVDTVTDVDLLSYSMGMDYDSAYSGVTVSCLASRVETRPLATILLYQGSRQVLSAGDVDRQFIEPPANEDWPWVDTGMDILAVTGDVAGFNRGRRSWTGATRVSADGEGDWWAQGAQGNFASFEFETINARRWLHTISIGTGLASDQTIETRTMREGNSVPGTGLWSQWDSFSLPVIRGYARVTWLDEKRYAAAATTMTLPRLEHDCSWWVQGSAVQRLTDWLATEYGSSKVTISGLSVIPDARREIGDVIRITDSTYAGLTATAVITGIRYEISDGQASQSLDVELTSVSATGRTYADVQAQAGTRTYAQFQALIGAVTYSEQEAQ